MEKERIEKLVQRLNAYEDKLENDMDYEMSDEMQEEYYFFQEEFRELDEMMVKYDPSLKRKFEHLSNEFENPNSVTDSTLNMMFPDTNGNYDLDEMDFD